MKPINPNPIAYFMGFNAFRLKRSVNPFRHPTQNADDWLNGFLVSQTMSRTQESKV